MLCGGFPTFSGREPLLYLTPGDAVIQFAFEKVTLDAAWTVNWKGRRDSERPDEQLNWSGQPRIKWVREVWKSGEYHFCLPVISVAPLYRRLASLVSQNKVPRVNASDSGAFQAGCSY